MNLSRDDSGGDRRGEGSGSAGNVTGKSPVKLTDGKKRNSVVYLCEKLEIGRVYGRFLPPSPKITIHVGVHMAHSCFLGRAKYM